MPIKNFTVSQSQSEVCMYACMDGWMCMYMYVCMHVYSAFYVWPMVSVGFPGGYGGWPWLLWCKQVFTGAYLPGSCCHPGLIFGPLIKRKPEVQVD